MRASQFFVAMTDNDEQASRPSSTVKVSLSFHRWIKVEAATRGVTMYSLLEELCGQAIGSQPWLDPADLSSESLPEGEEA